MEDGPGDVTRLLVEISNGSREAQARLMPLVYNELRRLAAHYMRSEQPGNTLQATALVHEVYLRLVDWQNVNLRCRGHLFGVAAQMMRRILVDHARAKFAAKRGGSREQVSLDEALVYSEQPSEEILVVDEALTKLAAWDADQARIVELMFFGGLTAEETAETMDISVSKVKRDWSMARAWLHKQRRNLAMLERRYSPFPLPIYLVGLLVGDQTIFSDFENLNTIRV
jgi:RNA polymerase sigma factor (TIGR02999 family)